MPGQRNICTALGESRVHKKRLVFSAWNINGINDRILGDKFNNLDFLSCINKFDFLVLTETWTHQTVHTPGFKCFTSTPMDYSFKTVTKNGRSSDGVMIFVKNSIASYISVQKSSKNFIWCQIDKRLSGSENHIYFCGAYIHSINSKYFSPEIFEELENDIAEFQSRGAALLSGDFNSRTGKHEDYIPDDSDNFFDYSVENPLVLKQRNNYDVVNNHGKNLLEICKNFDLRILNGRIRGDSFGNVTIHSKLGVSIVDYFICDQSIFKLVDHFIVRSPTYLSDHSQLVTRLNISEKAYTVKPTENASLKPLNRLPSQFIWTGESSVAFKHELATPETQELINNFLHCNYE